LDEKALENLRDLGKKVLELRQKYNKLSLGDLYDPEFMPVDLLRVHEAADKEILRSYGLKPSSTEAEIVKELFMRYQKLAGEGSLI
jgi:hypothetical protein